jgi:hypothetical protein
VTGPLMARRQPRRRRITPNANTSTTTMISTHNHVDMAASLVGAGPVHGDATAAHPSKQLGHGQAISRSGSTAALRTGSQDPCTHATCPPIWAGRAGANPAPVPVKPPLRAHECSLAPSAPGRTAPGSARQPTTRQPGGPSASGHAQPAQPQPYRPARHERRTGQASTDPKRPHRARPAGMARPSSVCPAWVGEQSKHGCVETHWQTPRRRRRTDGARLRRHPNLRRERLHRPALPVQPRSALRDPPRLGPAGGDSAAHRQQGHGRG